MTNKIINEINSHLGNVSILVKDLRENKIIIESNIEERVVSASIIKVMILMCLYDKINKNKLSLYDKIKIDTKDILYDSILNENDDFDFTIKDLATWMIIESDNLATNILIDLISFDEINTFFRKLGLKNTLLTRKMLDFNAIRNGINNFTSLQDSSYVMELLYRGNFVSNEISNNIIDILIQQRDYRLLKRYIYDCKIAHKTGELPGILHDMGIIYGKKTDYFIGIFITEVVNLQESEKFIGRISRLIYQYLNQ